MCHILRVFCRAAPDLAPSHRAHRSPTSAMAPTDHGRLYRVVADPNDPQLANVQALVQRTQDDVNSTIPDFVPFHTTDNSDGLDVYRSHYTQSTILGNNGTLSTSLQGNTLGGPSEAGGDMGGCIEKNPASAPGVLNCKQ